MCQLLKRRAERLHVGATGTVCAHSLVAGTALK